MAESNAAQLSQLARLLFDRAAFRWYLSIGFEVLVSVMSALLAVIAVGPTIAPLSTLTMLALLGTAYGLRVLAEDAHCTAETMRR